VAHIGAAPGGGSSAGALSKDSKTVISSEAEVIKSVLSTLGALAQQAGTSFKPYVGDVMPLVIESIQVGLTKGGCFRRCSAGSSNS
jgi:hypothetical protein